MTRSRLVEDPTLPLFPAGPRGEPSGRIDPELVVARPATDSPFRLDGERVAAFGTERGPLDAIRIDGVRVVLGLRTDSVPVANVLISPGLVRRERIGPAGSSDETFMVLPTLPLAWVGSTRGERLELTVLPDATSIRYHLGEGSVTLSESGTDRLLSISPIPPGPAAALELRPEGGALLTFPATTGPRALAIGFGGQEGVRTALRASEHLATHERRAGRASGDGSVTLDTGSRDLDEGVTWMTTRLSSGIRLADRAGDLAGGDPLAWLWAGLGAVAVADEESAGSCVQALRRLKRDDAAALVAGRLALTTGRTEFALEHATDLPPKGPLAGLSLRVLADALRYAAPDALLARLRSEGSGTATRPKALGGLGTRAPSGERGRALPMAAPGGSPSVERWLSALLEEGDADRPLRGPPALPHPSDERGVDEAADPGPALAAWAGLSGEPDEGWTVWRSQVATGYEGSAWGVAAWDPLAGLRPPAVTGILLAAMVHGWLGIYPDAPVGRLRLAPRLPPRLNRFAVRGIAVGDARVGLTYTRSGSDHRFDLEPEWGRVPPLVVFETVVPNPVEQVTIDGIRADLDLARGEGRTTIRLQTPVDARRRIEILGG